MASPESHARYCAKKHGEYMADKRCDICGGSNDLAHVYRKRWWMDVGLTMWAQSGYNLRKTLERSRITCRPCIEARIDHIRSVLLSGERFDSCQEDDCPKPVAGRGYCDKHRWAYMRLAGVQPRRMGPRGAGRISEQGYRFLYLPGHPNANKYGRVAEHRVVMAEKLGRPLRPDESPHHKNGSRLDNRPENLELWVVSQPPGQRAEDLLAWARDIIDRYADEADRGLLAATTG